MTSLASKRFFSITFTVTQVILLISLRCGTSNQTTDEKPWWDADGDNISDAVETNEPNSYLNLNPQVPNPDPTIAHGHLDVGWLENGLNLVDNEPQYYHYLGTDQQDIDDWGTRALITTLECGARLWLDNYWTGWDNKIKMIGIGDMSLQEGGSFPPHVGHQNGREVDIRYMRTDAKYGEEEGRLDLSDEEQRKLYDPQETVNVLNGLCGYGIQADRKYGCAVVVKIIVAKREWSLIFLEEGNPIELIYDESGEHDNHMHIVIEDPDGEGN